MRYTPEDITSLAENEVFVFGSNAAGAHGKGAAKLALDRFGAIYGQAEGPQGRSYAIVTKKDWRVEKSSTLEEIRSGISRFLSHARNNQDKTFLVTLVGSSNAGYERSEIKEQFRMLVDEIPQNVVLPRSYEVRRTELILDTLERLKFFQDPKFKFYPGPHKYLYDGMELTSVTTKIGEFYKKFDTEYHANRIAARDGLSVSEVKESWKKISDKGLDIGSQTHNWLEAFWRRESLPTVEHEEVQKRIAEYMVFHNKHLYQFNPVAFECRLFNLQWKLSGTLDGLFERGDKLYIGDWKTNKQFRTDTDMYWEMMLKPFGDLKDNELNRYSIQVSFYRIMLEEVGINVHDAFLCHIPGADKDITIYKAKDLRGRLRKYLDGSYLFFNDEGQGLF